MTVEVWHRPLAVESRRWEVHAQGRVVSRHEHQGDAVEAAARVRAQLPQAPGPGHRVRHG